MPDSGPRSAVTPTRPLTTAAAAPTISSPKRSCTAASAAASGSPSLARSSSSSASIHSDRSAGEINVSQRTAPRRVGDRMNHSARDEHERPRGRRDPPTAGLHGERAGQDVEGLLGVAVEMQGNAGEPGRSAVLAHRVGAAGARPADLDHRAFAVDPQDVAALARRHHDQLPVPGHGRPPVSVAAASSCAIRRRSAPRGVRPWAWRRVPAAEGAAEVGRVGEPRAAGDGGDRVVVNRGLRRRRWTSSRRWSSTNRLKVRPSSSNSRGGSGC